MRQLLEYFGLFSTATILAFGLIKYLSQNIFENYLRKSIETQLFSNLQIFKLTTIPVDLAREVHDRRNDDK